LVAFLLVSDRFPSQGLHIPPTYPSRYTTMLKLKPLTEETVGEDRFGGVKIGDSTPE